MRWRGRALLSKGAAIAFMQLKLVTAAQRVRGAVSHTPVQVGWSHNHRHRPVFLRMLCDGLGVTGIPEADGDPAGHQKGYVNRMKHTGTCVWHLARLTATSPATRPQLPVFYCL